MVLMCILIIEFVWVEKYGKMGENPPFLGIFEGWYRNQTEWYRYHKCSVILFWTSVSILAITWSFRILIELFKFLIKLDFKANKTP